MRGGLPLPGDEVLGSEVLELSCRLLLIVSTILQFGRRTTLGVATKSRPLLPLLIRQTATYFARLQVESYFEC